MWRWRNLNAQSAKGLHESWWFKVTLTKKIRTTSIPSWFFRTKWPVPPPPRFSSSISILHRSTNLRTRSSHNEEKNYFESYLPKHDSCGRWYKYFISCTADFAKEPLTFLNILINSFYESLVQLLKYYAKWKEYPFFKSLLVNWPRWTAIGCLTPWINPVLQNPILQHI